MPRVAAKLCCKGPAVTRIATRWWNFLTDASEQGVAVLCRPLSWWTVSVKWGVLFRRLPVCGCVKVCRAGSLPAWLSLCKGLLGVPLCPACVQNVHSGGSGYKETLMALAWHHMYSKGHNNNRSCMTLRLLLRFSGQDILFNVPWNSDEVEVSALPLLVMSLCRVGADYFSFL